MVSMSDWRNMGMVGDSAAKGQHYLDSMVNFPTKTQNKNKIYNQIFTDRLVLLSIVQIFNNFLLM